MRLLDAACADVRDGHGRVVVVSAASGVGKTRLCEEGAVAARRAGLIVAWGRCWPDGGAPALWPWQPGLAELCGADAAELLDQDVGSGNVDPERFSRFVAVVDRLAQACARRPAYLVIDDLHAADPAAVLLTRFVARMRHRLRLLMVITRRPDAGDPRNQRLVDELEPEASIITLPQFGLAETRALLAGDGLTHADPELLRIVHRVTGGNALYLHRLLPRSRSPARGSPG